MSKMKDTATKSKSSAMTKPKSGEGQMTFGEQKEEYLELQKRGWDSLVPEAAVGEAAGLIDKMDLVGVPFMLLGVREHKDGQFCTAQILLRDNTLTAFHASLADTNQRGEPKVSLGHEIFGLLKDGIKPPVLIRSGLRVSSYDDPKYGTVHTFYLDCSPSKEEMKVRAASTKVVGANANGRQTSRA